MRTLLRAGWVVLLTVAAAAVAEDFTRSLTPEEFAAAGLNKLTPEELARLDALVRAQRSGEVAKAREETAKQVRTETEAKVRAEVAAEEEKKPHRGFLGRMKVMLTPGTQVEYERVETELVGSFRGYDPGKVLTLSNGQQWQVTDGTYWAPKKDANKPRKVIIEPGTLGSFFLNIEDGGRPKVKFYGTVK
ncbi:MAG TPA: hypothetical protein VHE13_18150 [Opitutus sp.]|nr:hypothetical protein [Opitutus sp.]